MKNSRRQFLKNVGAASGGLASLNTFVISSRVLAAPKPSHPDAEHQPQFEEGFVRIRNPRKLKVDRLAVERVPIGPKGHYKPSIAKLEGDELLMVCYDPWPAPWPAPKGTVYNPPGYQYRSKDGGRTWSSPEKLDTDNSRHGGGEPYLFRAKDGTLLMTGGSYGYCSEDNGRTWLKRLQPEDFAAKVTSNVARNFLQLKDGRVLQIVDIPEGKKRDQHGNEHVALSSDNGRTWSEVYPCKVAGVPAGYEYSAFNEAWLWQSPSGKLYAIARIDSRSFPLPGRVLSPLELASAACSLLHYGLAPVSRIAIPPGEPYFDQFDRLKIWSSSDLGRSWQPGLDVGDYGYMFPSLLQLHDGRLLLTYTVRSIDPPLGVRVVLGREEKDGLRFDFERDVIMIDTKTPIGRRSGGGFGPTIQLDDGTLITAYCYWPPEDKRKATDQTPPNPSQCEVARWRLPAST